jgi:hypothetical protein
MSGIRTILAIAGVIVLLAFVLPAAAETTTAIGCHIRAIVQTDALRLEAIAEGPKSANGTYRFEVSKMSSSGTSQNVQSGDFRLDPRHDEVLTTVILDGSAVEHYRARLILDSTEFGRVSCVSP